MTQELISKKDTSSYTNGNGSYQNNLTNIKNSPAKSMAKQVPAVPKTSQANPMDKVVASVLTAVPAEMKKQGYAQKNVQLILEQCRATNMHDPHKVAYVLATAQHESKFGTPTYKRSESLVEDHNPYKFDSNTQKWSTHRGEKTLSADSEEQLDQEYWDDHYGGRLGNKKSSMDASNFRGRGFVQLTGRDNYKKMSNQLNKEGFTYTYDGVTYGSKDNPIDLVTHFDHVNKVQALAARILVSGMDEGSFSGRRMDQFINDKKTDYTGARKVVNGSDRAQQIADYAKRYEKVLTNQDAWKRVFDDEKTYGDSPIGRSSQASFLLSKNSPISHIVSSTAPTSTHTNLHSNGRNSFAKSPAPNLSADPAKTTVDNVSSSAIKEALKIHEIGSASPYKISYAEKGKSGG
jgi:predicted chitinase